MQLDRWLPIPRQEASAAIASVPAAPIDRSVLAVFLDGDTAMELEILHDFRIANDADAAMMKQAVAERDIALVTRASHRISTPPPEPSRMKTPGLIRGSGVHGRASGANRVAHVTPHP